jgi:hypothetical protein
VKVLLDTKVAGTLGTGESLGVLRRPTPAHGVRQQAPAQQHVVAELPGPLDRLRSRRPRSFWLAAK